MDHPYFNSSVKSSWFILHNSNLRCFQLVRSNWLLSWEEGGKSSCSAKPSAELHVVVTTNAKQLGLLLLQRSFTSHWWHFDFNEDNQNWARTFFTPHHNHMTHYLLEIVVHGWNGQRITHRQRINRKQRASQTNLIHQLVIDQGSLNLRYKGPYLVSTTDEGKKKIPVECCNQNKFVILIFFFKKTI